MMYRVTVLPGEIRLEADGGQTLLSVLRKAGLQVDAPCGGEGRCGKCKVWVDGREVPACRTVVDRDMTVRLPDSQAQQILTAGADNGNSGGSGKAGYLLAFDIGTTTVVGYLLDGKTGEELACVGATNPQRIFGADVISRIRLATQGQMEDLTSCLGNCLENLTWELCRMGKIQPQQVRLVSVVGNPAMQQFLMRISPENLAKLPFVPVLTQAKTLPAGEILPVWENAEFLVVPDIAGFVGADTVACILATGMDLTEKLTLLVDIGTNGEMVLGNRNRMVACSTAAGPALEGANIRFGMGGEIGAIDHVWLEQGVLHYSVIGGGEPRGICGSGLIDGVAAALDAGWLNQRGKILHPAGVIPLTEEIYLTQEDIRQVQPAKGAIGAGIRLMADRMGVVLEDIQRVCLAGAFGTYMNPKSACRIGLLPPELEDRIEGVGNAAGSGAKLLACSAGGLSRVQSILAKTEPLELAALPEFPRCFARYMRF